MNKPKITADTAIARKGGLNVRSKTTKSLLIMNPRPMISSVAFEIRRFDRDVAHHVEALRIDRLRERHIVRVGEELLVPLADRSLAEHGLLPRWHQDRIVVVEVGERRRVFLVRRGDPLLVTILNRSLDVGLVFLRQGRQHDKAYECEREQFAHAL